MQRRIYALMIERSTDSSGVNNLKSKLTSDLPASKILIPDAQVRLVVSLNSGRSGAVGGDPL